MSDVVVDANSRESLFFVTHLKRISLNHLIVLFAVAGIVTISVILYRKLQIRNELNDVPERIVAEMSLDQKIGQLIHVGIAGKTVDAVTRNDLTKHFVGGVILFAQNLGTEEETTRLNGELQKLAIEASGVPLFISIDQEGGRVVRVESIETPGAMAIGQTGNTVYAEDAGFITGYRLKKLGFNLLLAPVLDVNNNPDNPVINTRSFGSDPLTVAAMGNAFAKGVRDVSIVPVIKHFPGHGNTSIDSHLALPRITRTYDELEKTELIPFRSAIYTGAEAVMSAHILFPDLDTEYPATLSKKILGGVLREKLHYDGLILTDAMEMHAISKNFDTGEAAKKAFQAGADIILLTSTGKITRNVFGALKKGFESGELSIEALDRSVKRQVRLKFQRGAFYRTGSPLLRSDRLKEYFKSTEERTDRLYDDKIAKYGEKGLNYAVSSDAIRSLRKTFDGIHPQRDFRNIKLFYRTAAIKQHAIEHKIPENRMLSIGSIASLSKLLSTKPKYEIWIVELSDQDLPAWNRFVLSSQKRFDRLAPLVALYSGNPFLPIAVPAEGAVLVSFSPETESLHALFDRSLDEKPVRRAQLILGKELKPEN